MYIKGLAQCSLGCLHLCISSAWETGKNPQSFSVLEREAPPLIPEIPSYSVSFLFHPLVKSFLVGSSAIAGVRERRNTNLIVTVLANAS